MAEQPFDEWTAALFDRASRSRVGSLVARSLAQQPDRASQASAAEMAELAGVNTAGVTRSAQLLGFSGWPELREELRARHLTSLSMAEIAARHAGERAPSASARSFRADQKALTTSAAMVREADIRAAVSMLTRARVRAVMGTGSYAVVAQLLAWNASAAGYPTTYLAHGGPLSNGVSRMGDGDALVAISFWRISAETALAVQLARSRGVEVCVITDHAPSPLTESAHHVLKVSAESAAHFPSMVPAIALVNALCGELAAVDPDRTRRAVADAEAAWTAMNHFLDPRA